MEHWKLQHGGNSNKSKRATLLADCQHGHRQEALTSNYLAKHTLPVVAKHNKG
jgi:hypothetical protein